MRRFFGERQYRDQSGFRWRGGEISRLEGFSDAVFAFSVTLLIVSLEVPRTFGELLHTMKGFFAFGASFAILLWIWHVHYMFFRRYGLQDAFTKTMNAVLLFIVLFYVYPLKFVFTNVISFWSGGQNSTRLSDGTEVPIVQQGDAASMMIIYGLGFIAVFIVYTLLYWYAHRKREELHLNELEQFLTRMFARQYVICVSIGIVSVIIAFTGGDQYAAYSGLSYFLLGPALGIHGFLSGRKSESIRQRLNLGLGQQQYPQQQQRPPHHQQRPPQQQRQPQQQQRQPQQQRPPQQHQRRPPQQRPQGPPPPPEERGR